MLREDDAEDKSEHNGAEKEMRDTVRQVAEVARMPSTAVQDNRGQYLAWSFPPYTHPTFPPLLLLVVARVFDDLFDRLLYRLSLISLSHGFSGVRCYSLTVIAVVSWPFLLFSDLFLPRLYTNHTHRSFIQHVSKPRRHSREDRGGPQGGWEFKRKNQGEEGVLSRYQLFVSNHTSAPLTDMVNHPFSTCHGCWGWCSASHCYAP